MKLFIRKLWIFRPFYKLYYLDNNYYLIVINPKDVDDYFEKVGLIQAMKEGISPPSVRMPLREISVHE